MNIPDALILIAPQCPFCPGILESLARLVKEGAIGRLEVVNVAVHPEKAQELGVRGVPWVRLGPFELEGAIPPAELRRWAEQSGSDEAFLAYVEQTLAEGGLARVERLMRRAPDRLARLLPLLERDDLPMQVRVGVSAIFEGFTGTPPLQALIAELGRLASHGDHRVRSDACHLLGLTRSAAAAPFLEARLTDENAEVREIARDALSDIATPSAP